MSYYSGVSSYYTIEVCYTVFFSSTVEDVGLGHVDAPERRPPRARVHRPRCLAHLPLWLARTQHELLLPGRLLQEALIQRGARRGDQGRGQVSGERHIKKF